MLDEATVRQLLEPFGLSLRSDQIGKLIAYLELLLRWNEKINLTGIRDAPGCVRRHFGESLYLGRWVELDGRLLDIGSGAGFPGLCLKIIFPDLSVTLLEPVAKKRAFLKEVARVCGMSSVEVRRERLEDFAGAAALPVYDGATSRAVGHVEELMPLAARCLKAGGQFFLWLSRQQARHIGYIRSGLRPLRSLPLPGGPSSTTTPSRDDPPPLPRSSSGITEVRLHARPTAVAHCCKNARLEIIPASACMASAILSN
jgi:16S rRNA (guanine527-N7)-methyltransferase